jgi:peptidoglycan DL-endopeptidase CwlO
MSIKKSNVVVSLVLLLSLSCMSKATSYEVKADAAIKDPQVGVVVKSADIKSDRVITVPEKAAEKQSVLSGAGVSLSRGGSGRTDIISYASKFMGKPYVWGASGPSAFDCSGFTAYVYSAFGVGLPHYTGSQFSVGQSVSSGNLAAGDLVFFNTYGPISHVGIYIGGGQFIHASSGSHRITVSGLSESYYSSRYAGARRVLK